MLAGLARRLRSEGRDVLATHEPGGTPVSDAVRKIVLDPELRVSPATEALLMSAARAQLVADVIRPALSSAKWVLCDRYTTSTLAYQGYGHGVALASLQALATLATGGLEPDVTLLVDIPVEVSRARVAERAATSGRAEDRLEREDETFHTRVRNGYLELARADRKMHVLDGLRATDALVEEAYEIVTRHASSRS